MITAFKPLLHLLITPPNVAYSHETSSWKHCKCEFSVRWDFKGPLKTNCTKCDGNVATGGYGERQRCQLLTARCALTPTLMAMLSGAIWRSASCPEEPSALWLQGGGQGSTMDRPATSPPQLQPPINKNFRLGSTFCGRSSHWGCQLFT